MVVITSNRTREIHDAVKRRCFYHWVDYPDAKRELEILRRKAPRAAERLSREVVAFVQRLRQERSLQAARAWPRPSTGRTAWSRSTAWRSTPRR